MLAAAENHPRLPLPPEEVGKHAPKVPLFVAGDHLAGTPNELRVVEMAARIARDFYPELGERIKEVRLQGITRWKHAFDDDDDVVARVDVRDRIAPVFHLFMPKLKKDEDLEDALGYEMAHLLFEPAGLMEIPFADDVEDRICELLWISRAGAEAEVPGHLRYAHLAHNRRERQREARHPSALRMPFPQKLWIRFAEEARHAATEALHRYGPKVDAIEYWEARMAAKALPTLPWYRRTFGWPLGGGPPLYVYVLLGTFFDFIFDAIAIHAGHPLLVMPSHASLLISLEAWAQDMGQLIPPALGAGYTMMRRHAKMAAYFNAGRWGGHTPIFPEVKGKTMPVASTYQPDYSVRGDGTEPTS